MLCVLLAAAAAAGDLYGVALIAPGYDERRYYRISTVDASVTLVNQFDEQSSLVEMELGPDGLYYGAAVWQQFERVDPITGGDDMLFNFGDSLPTGGLAITPQGLAYASYSGALPGSGLFRYNVFSDVFMHHVSLPHEFIVRALHYRDDGVMLATEIYENGVVYEIDLSTGAPTPVGAFDPAVGEVLSFATDPLSGQVYMLAGDLPNAAALYEVDMHTFEATLIGELPGELAIVGIAAIACAADFNGDGVLNVLDFVAFQVAWQAGDGAADVNGDGVFDVLDFVAFQGVFIAGC